MTDVIQFHKQRLDQLRTDRSQFDSQWEEVTERVLPMDRMLFSSQGKVALTPGYQGQKKTELQFDATAALACQRFAAVMESISVPKNSKWHYVVSMDKSLKRNRRVREFFEAMTDVLFRYRYAAGSGFVTNSQQAFLSLGAYGNASVYVDAPEEGKGLRYRAEHLSTTYFVENHARLIDTMYRPFPLTARQAVGQFGNRLPDIVKTAAAQPSQTENKFQFLHVVHPNSDFVPGMIGPQGREFMSRYICLDGDAMEVGSGGYRTFPYPTMRYTQAAGEVYGRGPAQWVLPSIKLLNEQKKTHIKVGHRNADPVLLAYDDGALDGFVMRSGYLNKGGMTADGKPLVGVLPAGRVDISDKMMEMERSVINDAFLISLFQILVENPQMTATEVMERMKEKGMLLAPTAGRLEEEFLGPLIGRELDVLGAQFLLPEVPPILAQAAEEIEYTTEYDSPMSRMRRAESGSGFTRALGVISEYVKFTGDPSPLDYINFDVATPELLDIFGTPVAWTATEEQVAAKRDARAKAAETEQMANAAPGIAALAKAVPAAAKAAVPVA